MLEIKDVKLMKITKVKPWAIYFTYDNERYLLHESSEAYDTVIRLYKRELNKFGNYKLEFIIGSPYCDFFSKDYLGRNGSSIPYCQIDLDLFCKRMTRDKFFCGAYEKDIEEMRERVGFIIEDNQLHEKCIRRNNEDKRKLLDFKM